MSIAYRLTLLSLYAAAAAAVAPAGDTGTVDTGTIDTGVVDTGVVVPDNPGPIILVAALDEHRDRQHYCADVIGPTVEEGDQVHVHTCKDLPRPSEDMRFTTDSPNFGHIKVTRAHNLCVAAARYPSAGVHLDVVPCSSTDGRQEWTSDASGQIHPAHDPKLCWVVDDTRKCGNPDCSNFKRDLTLGTCTDYSTRYTTWTIPGGSVGL